MVSVIMSVYNAEEYLAEAIESILLQTFEDFEFIIVDDKSRDNSLNIIKKYNQKDGRIKLIKNKQNLGLTRSLNKGLSIAKYKYIARMDADDISMSDRFEKQVEFLEGNKNIDILGSYAYDINSKNKIIGERRVPLNHSNIIEMLPILSPLIHPSVMVRKISLDKINGYNEKYRTSQDYELWFRAASKGLKFHNLPEYLLKYRMDNNYYRRKSIKYRLNDMKIRYKGYKQNNIPFHKWYLLFIPFIIGIIPKSIYKYLKIFDPRN